MSARRDELKDHLDSEARIDVARDLRVQVGEAPGVELPAKIGDLDPIDVKSPRVFQSENCELVGRLERQSHPVAQKVGSLLPRLGIKKISLLLELETEAVEGLLDAAEHFVAGD